MNKKIAFCTTLCLLMLLGAASCNDKSSGGSDDYFGSYTKSSTLISDFTLQENEKVMSNLDSVHFVIDQDRHIIYNPDSLPVGTDVTHLTASITFPSTVSLAEFTVAGGKVMADTTFGYTSTTTDSIDFTGNVQLKVVSYDQTHTRIYRIQVNVHTTAPDSIYWDRNLLRDLPGSSSATTDSRVVRLGSKWLCLLNNGNGSYVLSTADAPGQKQWTRQSLTLPFTPQLQSLTATDADLYMLSASGELYRSTDSGLTWSTTGQRWHSIKGGYAGRVLGVALEGGKYCHDEYPRPAGFSPVEVEDGFPVSGSSPMVAADNGWAAEHQAMLVGGVTAGGQLTGAVWGYDGSTWARISNDNTWRRLPALKGASLIKYYTYDVSATNFTTTRRETWMVMGGTLADGSLNRVVYSSRDQGLLWQKADSTYQLPAYVPSFTSAQAYVHEETLSATLPWKAASTTAPTQHQSQWQCPYIYLFGGHASNGMLLNTVWRAVLGRMAMRPVY